jgi:hypothetical protein
MDLEILSVPSSPPPREKIANPATVGEKCSSLQLLRLLANKPHLLAVVVAPQ